MKITFEGSTLAEVMAGIEGFVSSISGLLGAPTAVPGGIAPAGPGRPVGAKDSAPRKRGPNKAAVATPAVVTPINAETPAAPVATAPKEPANPAAPAVSAPTLTDAQEALAALFEAKGMQDSLKVLAQFKVKKVQELKPADFADFIDAAITASK